MTILLAIEPASEIPPWRERFAALLPGRRLVAAPNIGARAEISYALSWRHRQGALAGLPNLRAIFSLGAGVDHLFSDPLLPDAPIVRVVDDDLTNRMSEWVVLHALLHLRQQRLYDRRQAERRWEEDLNQPAAKDVRVGVMGLGALGRDAARKLTIIGFDIAGWSRSEKRVEGVACFHGAAGLDAMLARTDILVCLLPLTKETRGILNARLFAKLARGGRLGGPILLNAGRGGLQVEADIVAALDSGLLKAASLDVFEREPLPDDSPLWRHPRVLISPHSAALSEPGAVARNIAAQIEAHERGEPLKNLVDRTRGY
ncbi:MAG TPA: glyoxylate/hydroxypyruvate reductase A [Roseiarcus sp.]|nr:glyoxylate/hydroxypyruvate reductase A [Roseiarcus sp.]